MAAPLLGQLTAPEQLPDAPDLTKDSQQRPFHTKRPHKKSRAGCTNCKARKVKCDEARPVCRSCRLRRAECSYPTSSPPSSVPGSTPPSSTPQSSQVSVFESGQPSPSPSFLPVSALSPASSLSSVAPRGGTSSRRQHDDDELTVVKQPAYRPPSVDDNDMKLLWFYTTSTSGCFSLNNGRGRPVEEILKSTLVQIAFEHRFLMDSIFAVASIHMEASVENVDHNRTVYYRGKALNSYRKAIAENQPHSYAALLANALLLTAVASESFRDQAAPDLFIIDWIFVWRGIGIMINLITIPGMFKAGIDPLFYRPRMDLDAAAAAIPDILLVMISTIPEDDVDYPHVRLYYQTLKILGTLYQNITHDFGDVMHLRVITWLTFLPQEFAVLARKRNQRALVILAHYACFFKITRKVWWVRGIGQRTLTDICNYLGPEYYPYIQVPLQAIGVDDDLALGRLILNDPTWFPQDNPYRGFGEPDERRVAWVDNEGQTVEYTIRSKDGELVRVQKWEVTKVYDL